MIAARLAVGLLPRLAVGNAHPGIVLRPIEDPAFARSVLVATSAEGSPRGPSTAVRQLVLAIRDGFAALSFD